MGENVESEGARNAKKCQEIGTPGMSENVQKLGISVGEFVEEGPEPLFVLFTKVVVAAL